MLEEKDFNKVVDLTKIYGGPKQVAKLIIVNEEDFLRCFNNDSDLSDKAVSKVRNGIRRHWKPFMSAWRALQETNRK